VITTGKTPEVGYVREFTFAVLGFSQLSAPTSRSILGMRVQALPRNSRPRRARGTHVLFLKESANVVSTRRVRPGRTGGGHRYAARVPP